MKQSKKRDVQILGQAPTPTQHPESERPKAETNSSPNPKIIPTPAANSERHECKPDQTPRWKYMLELAAFALGIYAVFVYRGQWNAASAANTLNSANFKMAQRAWVGPSSGEIVPPEAEKPIVWRVVYKNYGNSPAMLVDIRDTAQLFVSPQVDATAAMFLAATLPRSNGKTVTMFNGQTYDDLGGISFMPSPKQIVDIAQGRSVIVYVAEVTYVDIFQDVHHTKVCQVRDTLGTHSCGFGEDAN